jgi:hypothetical protein
VYLVVGAFLLLAVPDALAQITVGTVTGVVRDDQKLALPGATVELLNEQTGDLRQTMSNEAGVFTISAVPQGRHTLKVTLQGFRAVEQQGIQLRAGETFDAGTLTLGVGQLTEKVVVEAETAVVQTASAERRSVLEAEQLDSLIARGRDPMALLNLLPGVTPTTGTTSLGGQIGANTPVIAGQVGSSAGMRVDGMVSSDPDTGNNNSPMSMDAIEEMVVVLNGLQAEFGRNTGAQVNIVSKSGSQEYHGTLAAYIRNEGLNANSFFNNRLGLPKIVARYQTETGTLGGPVPVRGVRDRLFFFYNREMWRTKEPTAVGASSWTTTMPTPLERQGDFSQSLQPNGQLRVIRDPLTGQPFPGNRIPADRINPLGQAILNIFNQPNFFDRSVSGGNYNYRAQSPSDQRKTLDHVKVDFNATKADRFSALVRVYRPITEAYNGVFAVNSNWDHFRHGYAQRETSVQVNHNRTFGGAIVNQASFSYRLNTEVGPVLDSFESITRPATGLGALPRLYATSNDVIPALSFTGIPNAPTVAFDGRFPIDGGDQRWTLADTLSWAPGRHLVKAGFHYEYNINSEGPGPIQNCFSGCFNFDQTDANNPGNTGYAFANALLGNFTTYQEANSRPLASGRQTLFEWFGQDTWKMFDTLSVDYGLRFSWGQPWRVREGQPGAGWVEERFDPAQQPRLYRPAVVNGVRVGFDALTGQTVPAGSIGALVPNSGALYNGMVPVDDPLSHDGAWRATPPVQLGPRLGIAWDPTGSKRMSIRGAWGITKQIPQASGQFSFAFPVAPPVRLQPQLFYGTLNGLNTFQNQFFPENVTGFEPELRPQSTQHFSVELQRNLGFDSVVSVAYVGNRQRHISLTRNVNVVPFGARFNPANVDPTTGLPLSDNFLRPMIGLGNVSHIENIGTRNYDSLQVTGTRRYKNGLAFGGSYTLSKTTAMEGTLPLYLNDSWIDDYANSDRRHQASVNATWDLPRASQAWDNAFVRAVLDHWQLAGVAIFVSGAPATVTFTTQVATDILGGGDPGRIDVTCDPMANAPRTFDRWFDTGCFALPGRGDVGSSNRQMIRLPGSADFDLTVSKNFPMGAARRLQFRAELYNVLNRTNWTNVNTAAIFNAQGAQTNPQFGQVTAAGQPRVIQLSLRFAF